MSQKNKESVRDQNFRSRLQDACSGLVYISETDSDIVPVFGAKVSRTSTEEVLAAVGVSDKSEAETAETRKFFARLIAQKEWFNEKQRHDADRFRALKRLLEEKLEDLLVYRVGKIRVTIYVLGVDRDRRVAGIKMNAVET